MERKLPESVERLAEAAYNAGHAVYVYADPENITVRITTAWDENTRGDKMAGDDYMAAWVPTPSGGWRLSFTTDGWHEGLTLHQIREAM